MGITAKRWTDEEVQWLKDNYPNHTTQFCIQQLHVGARRILKKAAELGLQKEEKPKKPKKPKRKTDGIHIDEGAQHYCMECACYQVGGYCTRKKMEVGALWLKKCCKLRDDNDENHSKTVKIMAKGKRKKEWTENDDKVLREMYPTNTIGSIEVQLNRSRLSVYHRAYILGLKRK
jgi:hypothetical protein